MSTTSTRKVWFVTGASSGLGKAVVEHALSKGDRVSATCRKPSDLAELASKYPSSQLIVLQLDVTIANDIGAAFAKTVGAFGRVDVVYNNAAYSVIGEAEGTSEEIGRRLYDVNFWGAVNVAKEAVKVFREVNKPIGGVLLQASSIVGVVGHAGTAVYSSSKFALEGWSESLALELEPSWNIGVKLIEFGTFDTRGFKESLVKIPAHPAYDALPADNKLKQLRAWIFNNPMVEGDAAKAAREVYNIGSNDKSIKSLRIPLGLDSISVSEKRLADIKATIEETSKFSVDLKRAL